MTQEKHTTLLSKEDIEILTRHYDTNKDGLLSADEVNAIVEDCRSGKKDIHPEVKAVIDKYDTNHDGVIDAHELAVVKHDMNHIADTNARYLGYTAVFSRAFRYLAFTSDFGEALRPVVHARIVTSTYLIAFGYCFVDVGWEAYKLKKRGYVTEATEHAPARPMSMSQLVVERSIFQAVASIAVPFGLIHTAVAVAKKGFAKLGRFQKWGPSIIGLSAIPFLPMYLDHPIEQALEKGFQNYGPWAHQEAAHAKKSQ